MMEAVGEGWPRKGSRARGCAMVQILTPNVILFGIILIRRGEM
jgi:hypothetical protein